MGRGAEAGVGSGAEARCGEWGGGWHGAQSVTGSFMPALRRLPGQVHEGDQGEERRALSGAVLSTLSQLCLSAVAGLCP